LVRRRAGVNHVGHAYLVKLLLPALQAQAVPSRVVVLSSWGHTQAKALALDDLNWKARAYSPFQAYYQSKLANALFARELNARMAAAGAPVKAFAVHPGFIATPLMRHIGAVQRVMGVLNLPLLRRLTGVKTIPQVRAVHAACRRRNQPARCHAGPFPMPLPPRRPQGAATSIYAATAAALDAHGGRYLVDCALGKATAQAQDDALAAQLWEATDAMIAEGEAAAAAQA
jgi:hypothetical protein